MEHIKNYLRFINESEDSIEMIIDLIFKGGFEFDMAIEMIKTLEPLDKNRLADTVLADQSEYELYKKLGGEVITLFNALGLETSLSRPIAEWDYTKYTLKIGNKIYNIELDDSDFEEDLDARGFIHYTFVAYKKIFDAAERLGANGYKIYDLLDEQIIHREDVFND